MDQTLILVDSKDRRVGYAERSICHQGDGKLHRAIAMVLFDEDERVLLQKRRAELWDGYWDVSGATHPLHFGTRDESYAEAGERCLDAEWGIRTPLQQCFAFRYFARHAEKCENEYCVVLIGRFDGTPTINPDHAYDLRWVAFADCLGELQRAPEIFTPWAREALLRLRSNRPA